MALALSSKMLMCSSSTSLNSAKSGCQLSVRQLSVRGTEQVTCGKGETLWLLPKPKYGGLTWKCRQ